MLEGHESDFSGNFADAAAHAIVGESIETNGLLEVREPDVSKKAGAAVAAATAGESGGMNCLRYLHLILVITHLGVLMWLHVRVSRRCVWFLRLLPHLLPALVAHACFTPMLIAVNSWSDTGRVQGPTGRSVSLVREPQIGAATGFDIQEEKNKFGKLKMLNVFLVPPCHSTGPVTVVTVRQRS